MDNFYLVLKLVKWFINSSDKCHYGYAESLLSGSLFARFMQHLVCQIATTWTRSTVQSSNDMASTCL